MTDANKARLNELGWGTRLMSYGYGRLTRSEKRVAELEVRVLKLEKELSNVRDWTIRLADRYRARGYDARAIDRQVERIKEVLKP